jgi:hypothetical protein
MYYPHEIGADGVFTSIGINDGAYKRYRVTAAADHTITRAIAGDEAAESKKIADAATAIKKLEVEAAAKKKKPKMTVPARWPRPMPTHARKRPLTLPPPRAVQQNK